jgi:hypothetical protein
MRCISGTASSTEIHDIMNCRENVFVEYSLSLNKGMNPTKSKAALSVTISLKSKKKTNKTNKKQYNIQYQKMYTMVFQF